MNVHSGAATAHAEHHDGHGHHHQSFVSKYIFSQDHKTIANAIGLSRTIVPNIGNVFW